MSDYWYSSHPALKPIPGSSPISNLPHEILSQILQQIVHSTKQFGYDHLSTLRAFAASSRNAWSVYSNNEALLLKTALEKFTLKQEVYQVALKMAGHEDGKEVDAAVLKKALKTHFELLKLGNFVNRHFALDADYDGMLPIRTLISLYIFAGIGLESMDPLPLTEEEEPYHLDAKSHLDELQRDLNRFLEEDTRLLSPDEDPELIFRKLSHYNYCFSQSFNDAWRLFYKLNFVDEKQGGPLDFWAWKERNYTARLWDEECVVGQTGWISEYTCWNDGMERRRRRFEVFGEWLERERGHW